MKDTLTPVVYGREHRISTKGNLALKKNSKRPEILYIDVKNEKIYFSVCFISDIEKTVTRLLGQENFPRIIRSVLRDVRAVILETDRDSFRLISSIAETCLKFSSSSELPIILFDSASTRLFTQRVQELDTIDDVVSRQINTEDLKRKINVLRELKRLGTTRVDDPKAEETILTEKKDTNGKGILIKRAFDIIVATSLLVVLSPIMILIAILIKVTSRGPVFYKAERSGCNYKIFGFIKFRSMYVDADQKLEKMLEKNQYSVESKGGPVFFKMSDDPRITPIGRVLRNTSLDELPQLFNVLRGDMSLVGNRPLPLYEAKTLTTDDYAERFDAPAGITGLWQVEKRGAKEMSAKERIDLDIKYARNYSAFFDMKIMLRTPKALIQKENV